jgi:hypothetical protein
MIMGSKQMYKDSPRLEKNSDGKMGVSSKVTEATKEATAENGETGGMPEHETHSLHNLERHNLHAKHEHEHHVHEKHGGSKEHLHEKHAKEHHDMLKKHNEELAAHTEGEEPEGE